MKTVRISIMTLGVLLVHISALAAADLTHRALFQVNSLWGETTYEITPEDGISRLSWPMDMRLLGAVYTAGLFDIIEAEFAVHASPWNESGRPMEDCDWINETNNPDWVAYDALDVYSRSTVDAKAFTLSANVRAFLLSLPPASLGLLGGYHYQEADFRAYDTKQTGYGSWSAYTGNVSGPTTTYAVEYRFFHIGATFKGHIDRKLYLTVDTSYIPYARAEDEDNHLRRQRLSLSEATGTGGILSLSLQYFFTDTWYASTNCSKLHIKTSGDQLQYWYGNDPATPGFDDTGRPLAGIDVEIEQDTFHMGIGLGCRF
jgi:outer membrane protease